MEGSFIFCKDSLFAFEGFAICFLRLCRLLGAVVSNEDRLSVAFVLFSPVGARINCAQYVFCHEGSPPLVVVGNINRQEINYSCPGKVELVRIAP